MTNQPQQLLLPEDLPVPLETPVTQDYIGSAEALYRLFEPHQVVDVGTVRADSPQLANRHALTLVLNRMGDGGDGLRPAIGSLISDSKNPSRKQAVAFLTCDYMGVSPSDSRAMVSSGWRELICHYLVAVQGRFGGTFINCAEDCDLPFLLAAFGFGVERDEDTQDYRVLFYPAVAMLNALGNNGGDDSCLNMNIMATAIAIVNGVFNDGMYSCLDNALSAVPRASLPLSDNFLKWYRFALTFNSMQRYNLQRDFPSIAQYL